MERKAKGKKPKTSSQPKNVPKNIVITNDAIHTAHNRLSRLVRTAFQKN